MNSKIIEELFEIIKQRKNSDPESSYVASLFDQGTAKIVQKVGEEAVETCIEAMQNDKKKLMLESADLLFHLMVLWADQGIEPSDIYDVLQSRFGTSGHEEKANRKNLD